MEVAVYTQAGKEAKKLALPEEIFGVKWNGDLVSQVLYIQASNRRAGTAHTKDRSEVSGGGKKPWQQKGTGRARHGSSRSPIWRHGGVTHGPRNDKNYKKTLTESMKRSALFALLSAKVRDGKVLFVDSVENTDGKTKSAEGVMKNLSVAPGFKTITYKKVGNVLMTAPKLADAEKKGFRNLPYVTFANLSHLNPLDIANTRYLIITNPEETIAALSKKLA
jgi:large subunit ribosomal protein L4